MDPSPLLKVKRDGLPFFLPKPPKRMFLLPTFVNVWPERGSGWLPVFSSASSHITDCEKGRENEACQLDWFLQSRSPRDRGDKWGQSRIRVGAALAAISHSNAAERGASDEEISSWSYHGCVRSARLLRRIGAFGPCGCVSLVLLLPCLPRPGVVNTGFVFSLNS